MVIITLLPWHDTFLRLLTVLAEVRRLNKSEFRQFLAEVYNSGVPDLGCQLKLIYNGGQSVSTFSLTCLLMLSFFNKTEKFFF